MQANIEARLRRPARTPEEARVEALVCQIKERAQQIAGMARMGEAVIIHQRIGTCEQRRAETEVKATEILALVRRLDPAFRPTAAPAWAQTPRP